MGLILLVSVVFLLGVLATFYASAKLPAPKLPVCETTEYGAKEWRLNGNLHREDGPAVINKDGSKHWFLNGRKHRVGGPASEWADGGKGWVVDGKYHREDGPAVEHEDGGKTWYFDGEFVASDYYFSELKGNYIVVERGIPTDDKFGKLELTQAKLLTAEGTMFVYDNLPGLIIGEGND
jgi:hypothetical protein